MSWGGPRALPPDLRGEQTTPAQGEVSLLKQQPSTGWHSPPPALDSPPFSAGQQQAPPPSPHTVQRAGLQQGGSRRERGGHSAGLCGASGPGADRGAVFLLAGKQAPCVCQHRPGLRAEPGASKSARGSRMELTTGLLCPGQPCPGGCPRSPANGWGPRGPKKPVPWLGCHPPGPQQGPATPPAVPRTPARWLLPGPAVPPRPPTILESHTMLRPWGTWGHFRGPQVQALGPLTEDPPRSPPTASTHESADSFRANPEARGLLRLHPSSTQSPLWLPCLTEHTPGSPCPPSGTCCADTHKPTPPQGPQHQHRPA